MCIFFLSNLFLINIDKGLYSLLVQMVTYFYLYNYSHVLALIWILLCWIKGEEVKHRETQVPLTDLLCTELSALK